MLLLFQKCLENRQAAQDHIMTDTIADPEIAGTAKIVTGHQQ